MTVGLEMGDLRDGVLYRVERDEGGRSIYGGGASAPRSTSCLTCAVLHAVAPNQNDAHLEYPSFTPRSGAEHTDIGVSPV